MKRKFWNWIRNETDGERTLVLNGEISDETWYGDEVTPALFRKELDAGTGDITVWINSPGGDVFAAAQIYNMLMEYKGDVTVKVDALAASAASVIAMAGTEVLMSPVGMMMIHNPMTIAIGDSKEMQRAGEMLDEVKESIMNAYEIKTGIGIKRRSGMPCGGRIFMTWRMPCRWGRIPRAGIWCRTSLSIRWWRLWRKRTFSGVSPR